ncbi:hypothetical protein A3H75_00400 [Candidatus Uhrbacteria bacterium RIFCSPLOWO2_02_FULL_51_9]|uniref:Uncharacterized protein n=1 Tax=Candidatus Uhrbacteria bacterium RIFCSPLOWO2_02_FULL_51_9 TaxID=1802410 RepID=A0A1F7VE11_9BACT|nr:MAG: hypothetical protein A3H75_00400 [Candidatus Uhrbacteria bacterium RIFCSPLOWO2_02_FULL_51_9]
MGHEFARLSRVLSDSRVGNPVPFITVRATDATLTRDGETRILYVRMRDDTEVCANNADRRSHFVGADAGWFRDRLERFTGGIFNIPIGTPEHPLEIVTGDTCLVLVIEGARYVVSFLRDIDPVGWLIPGGCPQSLDELLQPKIVANRECMEEVIITDREGTILWHADRNNVLGETFKAAFAGWRLKTESVRLLESQPIPTAGIGTADRLVIEYAGKKHETTAPVFIGPEIASAAITLYREVEIPVPLADLHLYDGEMTPKGELIRRAVRLTDVWGNMVALFTNGLNALEMPWNTPRTADQATPPGFRARR